MDSGIFPSKALLKACEMGPRSYRFVRNFPALLVNLGTRLTKSLVCRLLAGAFYYVKSMTNSMKWAKLFGTSGIK